MLPTIIIVEQGMAALDVVAGGGVSLGLPLVLMGSPFPSQLGAPIPTSVILDLAGCLGCMSLSNSSAHVYIIGLCLTGLERPAVGSSGSSSGGGDGSHLSFPLWAFQFNRLSSSPSVTLYNVTLTLPQDEFRLLLAGLQAGLPAGPGPAGQQQLLSFQGPVELTVSTDVENMRIHQRIHVF